MTDPHDHNRIAARLVMYGSRFATYARLRASEPRSVVALRILSLLQQLGPIRIGDIALRERLSQPAISTSVTKLEADGLVARESDPTDARATVVRLTEAGDAEIRAFRLRAGEAVRPALEQLDEDEWVTLARATDILERLTIDEPPHPHHH